MDCFSPLDRSFISMLLYPFNSECGLCRQTPGLKQRVNIRSHKLFKQSIKQDTPVQQETHASPKFLITLFKQKVPCSTVSCFIQCIAETYELALLF